MAFATCLFAEPKPSRISEIDKMMIGRGIDRVEKWVVSVAVALAQLISRRVLFNVTKMPDARFLGFSLVIPFLALVAIPLFAADLVTLNIWIFDYSLPLDMSLRWVYGHVPHIDFQTPIGAAYWLQQGLATELIGVDARSPIVANFLAAAPIAIGAVLLLRPRLSGGIFGLMILAVMLLVISPRAPGDIPAQLSFLAAYNKVGLAILAIILAGAFVEPGKERPILWQALDSLILAIFLLWLIYLKVTFAAIAVGGVVAALHYAPRNRRAIILGVALSLLGVGIVGGLTGINSAYLRDLADAAGSGPPVRWGKLVYDINESRIALVIFLISAAFYWRLSVAERSTRISNIVVGIGLFAAGIVAMNQVHDDYLAITFVSLLVLSQRCLFESAGGSAGRFSNAFMPPLMGATALIMVMMLADAISSAHFYTSARSAEIGEPTGSLCTDPEVPICRVVYQAFDSSIAEKIFPLPNPTVAGEGAAAASVESGYRLLTIKEMLEFCDAHEGCVFWKVEEQLYFLLNRHITREDRPFFLGFTNILPYSYQLEPPKNVPAWMGVGRNISYESHIEPEILFSDVTLLVVPKVDFQTGRLPEVSEIYGPHIPSYFTLLEETDSWQIWRKS